MISYVFIFTFKYSKCRASQKIHRTSIKNPKLTGNRVVDTMVVII